MRGNQQHRRPRSRAFRDCSLKFAPLLLLRRRLEPKKRRMERMVRMRRPSRQRRAVVGGRMRELAAALQTAKTSLVVPARRPLAAASASASSSSSASSSAAASATPTATSSSAAATCVHKNTSSEPCPRRTHHWIRIVKKKREIKEKQKTHLFRLRRAGRVRRAIRAVRGSADAVRPCPFRAEGPGSRPGSCGLHAVPAAKKIYQIYIYINQHRYIVHNEKRPFLAIIKGG